MHLSPILGHISLHKKAVQESRTKSDVGCDCRLEKVCVLPKIRLMDMLKCIISVRIQKSGQMQ